MPCKCVKCIVEHQCIFRFLARRLRRPHVRNVVKSRLVRRAVLCVCLRFVNMDCPVVLLGEFPVSIHRKAGFIAPLGYSAGKIFLHCVCNLALLIRKRTRNRRNLLRRHFICFHLPHRFASGLHIPSYTDAVSIQVFSGLFALVQHIQLHHLSRFQSHYAVRYLELRCLRAVAGPLAQLLRSHPVQRFFHKLLRVFQVPDAAVEAVPKLFPYAFRRTSHTREPVHGVHHVLIQHIGYFFHRLDRAVFTARVQLCDCGVAQRGRGFELFVGERLAVLHNHALQNPHDKVKVLELVKRRVAKGGNAIFRIGQPVDNHCKARVALVPVDFSRLRALQHQLYAFCRVFPFFSRLRAFPARVEINAVQKAQDWPPHLLGNIFLVGRALQPFRQIPHIVFDARDMLRALRSLPPCQSLLAFALQHHGTLAYHTLTGFFPLRRVRFAQLPYASLIPRFLLLQRCFSLFCHPNAGFHQLLALLVRKGMHLRQRKIPLVHSLRQLIGRAVHV